MRKVIMSLFFLLVFCCSTSFAEDGLLYAKAHAKLKNGTLVAIVCVNSFKQADKAVRAAYKNVVHVEYYNGNTKLVKTNKRFVVKNSWGCK